MNTPNQTLTPEQLAIAEVQDLLANWPHYDQIYHDITTCHPTVRHKCIAECARLAHDSFEGAISIERFTAEMESWAPIPPREWKELPLETGRACEIRLIDNLKLEVWQDFLDLESYTATFYLDHQSETEILILFNIPTLEAAQTEIIQAAHDWLDNVKKALPPRPTTTQNPMPEITWPAHFHRDETNDWDPNARYHQFQNLPYELNIELISSRQGYDASLRNSDCCDALILATGDTPTEALANLAQRLQQIAAATTALVPTTPTTHITNSPDAPTF